MRTGTGAIVADRPKHEGKRLPSDSWRLAADQAEDVVEHLLNGFAALFQAGLELIHLVVVLAPRIISLVRAIGRARGADADVVKVVMNAPR